MRRLLSRWRMILLVAVGVLVAVQFVPYRVDNPSARDEPKWDSTRTRELAMRSCGDCHSNETKVAWFEQVAPLHWYIANHVKEGRAALNFSEWHTAAGEKAREAGEPAKEGSMPPGYYSWFGLHSDAKLSPAEVNELVTGLEKTIAADPPKGGGGG
jgi:hypothetical protein